MNKFPAVTMPPTAGSAKHSCHFSKRITLLFTLLPLFELLLTHMQASRRTFDMIEKRETLPSSPPPWGQTIWSGYGGSGKSVEPHSYAARVTDAM